MMITWGSIRRPLVAKPRKHKPCGVVNQFRLSDFYRAAAKIRGMRGHLHAGLIAALAISAPALAAGGPVDLGGNFGAGAAEPTAYLQCVPYARQVSGIQIYGDAWTWWDQAEGRYERGFRPQVGAVMAFKPQGNMRLGHVAAVSRIVDARTVLLRHANWSPIDGRRGQIEDDVRAIDVSPGNDWSEVRVWYDPIQNLGGTHWPLQGFIYNRPPRRLDADTRLAHGGQRDRSSGMQLARTDRETRSADPIGEIIAARSRTALAVRDDAWQRD
jgi:surface antigen